MSAVLASPAERLALSREQLRLAMHEANDPLTGEPRAEPWWARLQAIPGAGLAIEVIGQWWAHHPMQATVRVAADAATRVARPIAQRHPLGLVLGALVLGGLLVWSRPWRWALKPALFAGLLPQVLLAGLKQSPPQASRPRVP